MFHRPWFPPLLIACWCLATGWLVVAKILPGFAPGAPPGYQAFYSAPGDGGIVAWSVRWKDGPLGWATAESTRTPEGGLLVVSRLHFDQLPLDDLLQGWAGLVVKRLIERPTRLTFDAFGRIGIDPAGRLRSFRSSVVIPGVADDIVLEGSVNDDDVVAITARAGSLTYEASRPLPRQVMIGDELSPQASMPGLYEGRRWTVPTYSPLKAGRSPLEILHAEVGPEQEFAWHGSTVRGHVVAYRDDPANPRATARCRLWVERGGRVLRQESALLGATLVFERLPDDEAARLPSLAREPGP